MGKAKRIKQNKRLLLDQEKLVEMALQKGREQGFMQGMEHFQQKIETLRTVQGVGDKLHRRIIRHMYSLEGMESKQL